LHPASRGKGSQRPDFLALFLHPAAFRILPAACIYLAVIAMLTHASWRDLAGAAFFYGNYLPDESWFIGHFWSLALAKPELRDCL
jgi:hypothetical protein